MSGYEELQRFLAAVFSIDLGLSKLAEQRLALRYMANEEIADKLRSELRSAFNDPNLSWRKMLRNETYEVCDCDSEREAKEYAATLLQHLVLSDHGPKSQT